MEREPLYKLPNRLLKRLGFQVFRLARRDAHYDMKRFVQAKDPLVIFDVGANVGQTATEMRSTFRNSTVYCFEPGAETYATLKQNTARDSKISAWNLALGSAPGQQRFFENEHAVMSSLLPLGEAGWGTVKKESVVEVSTIDAFCASHGIPSIDILKSDTQGYDFEVLKGARGMLQAGRIRVLYFEFNFSALYDNLPTFDEVLRYLNGLGYVLEAIYRLNSASRNRAVFTDVLFIRERDAKDCN
jgi:FkbM family methyltransferase